MPRVTLWIHNDLFDQFDQEDNKSGLVNHLLEIHYEEVYPGSFKIEPHEDHIDISYQVKPKEEQGD